MGTSRRREYTLDNTLYEVGSRLSWFVSIEQVGFDSKQLAELLMLQMGLNHCTLNLGILGVAYCRARYTGGSCLEVG